MRDKDSDNEYNEAEDEDYNPDAIAADSASSSEDEANAAAASSRKRKANVDEELDSGDEVTIRERQSQKRKKQETEPTEDSFIRTRAQRFAEKEEAKSRKRGATAGRVTVDVDSLWAQLQTIPIGEPPTLTRLHEGGQDGEDPLEAAPPSEKITITRRVRFAGAITEVEEEVDRGSKEAQTWLAEQERDDEPDAKEKDLDDKVQRPLRRVSRFEPNPLGIVKGVAPDKLRRNLPSRVDLVMAERRQEEERAKRAEKLSTMQKTQLDWKGFVVEQGLGEELKEYGKSKKGYIAREAFLDKVHTVNESARRTARLKG